MFLLTANEIEQHVSAGSSEPYLSIVNFNRKMLQHTSYYFTLAREYDVITNNGPVPRHLAEPDGELILEPQQYLVVRSRESFVLSARVMAVFGQVSDFIASGLELVHSPFIDPMFRGQLVLGLWNRLLQSARLRLGQPIGKVSFFDVSDSRPIATIPGSILERKFEERQPQRDDDPVPRQEDDDSELFAPKPWFRD